MLTSLNGSHGIQIEPTFVVTLHCGNKPYTSSTACPKQIKYTTCPYLGRMTNASVFFVWGMIMLFAHK